MLYTCLRRLWLHPSQDVQHMLILLLPFSYVILLKAGWPRNGQRMSPDVRSSTLWAKMNFHHFLIKISDFDTTDDMHSQNIWLTGPFLRRNNKPVAEMWQEQRDLSVLLSSLIKGPNCKEIPTGCTQKRARSPRIPRPLRKLLASLGITAWAGDLLLRGCRQRIPTHF